MCSAWNTTDTTDTTEHDSTREKKTYSELDADNRALRQVIIGLRHDLDDLRTSIQETSDLNLITPYITRYYTEVFREVKKEFSRRHGNRNMTSLPYNTWIDMFSAASSEATRFDDFDTDQKPLNDLIGHVMQRMGAITEENWDSLQTIRRSRNNKGHPRLDDEKVVHAIDQRWGDHHAFHALKKMMNYLRKMKIRIAGGRAKRVRGSACHRRIPRKVR